MAAATTSSKGLGNGPVPDGKDRQPVTVPDFLAAKTRGVRLTMLTAYDYTMARLLDAAGVDVVCLMSGDYNRVLPGSPGSYEAPNDYLASIVAEHPKRIVGTCSVDPITDPAAAAGCSLDSVSMPLLAGTSVLVGNASGPAAPPGSSEPPPPARPRQSPGPGTSAPAR